MVFVEPSGLESAPPGYDPIEFRKSEVKDPCLRQTVEITATLLAAAFTVAEWTLFAADVALYYQLVRGPSPGSSPTLQSSLRGSQLGTVQGKISEPVVQNYAERLSRGEVPPPIKVDNGVIVDGNHRYAAVRLVGKEPPQIPGNLPPGQRANARPFENIEIDPTDWGNR